MIYYFEIILTRSTPLFLRGDLRCKHGVLFMLRAEFIMRKLIRKAHWRRFLSGTLVSLLKIIIVLSIGA